MLWTLIPAKSFHDAKQRLAPVLSRNDRARLSAALLSHTMRTARTALGDQPIMVVATNAAVAEAALAAGADRAFVPSASGLNPQLTEAAATVPAGDPVLVLHADLPRLIPADITALIETAGPMVIAPDHSGTGTNALLYRTEERFFAFGAESCARHLADAAAHGIVPAIIRRPGIAHDLDEPTDWQRLGETLPNLLARLQDEPGRRDPHIIEME